MRAPTAITKKLAIGTLGLAAAAGVGGAAWAVTSAPSSTAGQIPAALSSAAPAATDTSAVAAGTAGRRHGGLLRRADHASAEVKVKGQWVTYDLDRGTVTSVSPSSITLLRPDGQSVTFTINSSTRYGRSGSEQAIATGRPAAVISQNGVALRVRQGTGRPAAGAAASVS